MKKLSFYFFLISIIVLVGFNSCTIKKRLYQPGYYVEWHKINKETKPHQSSEALSSNDMGSKEEVVIKNHENIIEFSNQNEIIQEFEPVYASNDENATNIEFINYSKQKNTFITNTKKIASVKTEYKRKSSNLSNGARKVHWAAIVGLALGILSPFSIYIIGLGALLVCTAAIVFSGIALNAKIKNPEKFCGNGLAIAGLILGILNLFYTTFIILWVIFTIFF